MFKLFCRVGHPISGLKLYSIIFALVVTLIVLPLVGFQLSEKEKSTQFVKSFKILNNINFGMLVDSITEITTPEGTTVVDKLQIKEFCDNCDAKIINEIQDELATIRAQAQIKPIRLQATEEQIKKGAPTSYEVPVTFDSSNFFA